MLNKSIPALLTTVSLGGAVYYVTNFVESKILVKSITSNTISDLDWLRDRNPDAFQLKNTNTVGSVWNTWSEGNTYKDESYYVFDDWSWLNGVKISKKDGKEFAGGENLKSYVRGVGLKVESVKDTDTPQSNQIQKKRDIKVKRVLLSSDEGYKYWGGYNVFEKGTCFLKTAKEKAESDSNLYLLLGFATGKDIQKNNEKRPENFEFVEGYKSFCNWYASGKYGDGKGINVSFYLKDGKTITGEEYPVIASTDFRPLYFEVGPKKEKVNVVVLGIAIKGKMSSEEGQRAGKRLSAEEAKKIIQGKIKDQISGIYPRSSGGAEMIGFKIKSKNGNNNLEGSITDGWISEASATYTY